MASALNLVLSFSVSLVTAVLAVLSAGYVSGRMDDVSVTPKSRDLRTW